MGACDPAQDPPSHCARCLLQHRHQPVLSGLAQELLSQSLHAKACCKLLLPALEPPPGILCSNRSWGKPDGAEAPDMPLLGSCHIPQAQGNQLDLPMMQTSSTPCDLLKSSYLPL